MAVSSEALSRTDVLVVVSSGSNLDDDVVVVALSALDVAVAEIQMFSSLLWLLSALDVQWTHLQLLPQSVF
jgi:hypothetical protein